MFKHLCTEYRHCLAALSQYLAHEDNYKVKQKAKYYNKYF